MSDEFDCQGLSVMIDYWISLVVVKCEFEVVKSKYLVLEEFDQFYLF